MVDITILIGYIGIYIFTPIIGLVGSLCVGIVTGGVIGSMINILNKLEIYISTPRGERNVT